jgi:hypothetical protein
MSAKRLLRPRGQPTRQRFTVERCLKSSLPFLPDKEQDCIEMLRSKIIEIIKCSAESIPSNWNTQIRLVAEDE